MVPVVPGFIWLRIQFDLELPALYSGIGAAHHVSILLQAPVAAAHGILLIIDD
jgi:hypothetical protein